MRLVLQLVARLLVVVALCLSAATVWATIDAYRSVDRATAGSDLVDGVTGASYCCAATERANISCRCPIGAPSRR